MSTDSKHTKLQSTEQIMFVKTPIRKPPVNAAPAIPTSLPPQQFSNSMPTHSLMNPPSHHISHSTSQQTPLPKSLGTQTPLPLPSNENNNVYNFQDIGDCRILTEKATSLVQDIKMTRQQLDNITKHELKTVDILQSQQTPETTIVKTNAMMISDLQRITDYKAKKSALLQSLLTKGKDLYILLGLYISLKNHFLTFFQTDQTEFGKEKIDQITKEIVLFDSLRTQLNQDIMSQPI